jgi:hypothetical protein
MTRVMCNLWKRTFTLAPLTPLIVFSPYIVMVLRQLLIFAPLKYGIQSWEEIKVTY